jgi:hypothetical protein
MFLQMLLIKILIVYSNANTRLMLGLLLLLTLILNRKMLELVSFIVIVENFHYLKEKKKVGSTHLHARSYSRFLFISLLFLLGNPSPTLKRDRPKNSF